MKKNNIINDWLDKYGDPEIEKKAEIELASGLNSLLASIQNLADIEKSLLPVDYSEECCTNCGESENIHTNYDWSKPERPVEEYLCNECGTYFKPKK